MKHPTISEVLRARIEKHGVAWTARESGVSQPTLSRFMSETVNRNPKGKEIHASGMRMETIQALADAFNLTLTDAPKASKPD